MVDGAVPLLGVTVSQFPPDEVETLDVQFNIPPPEFVIEMV